MLKIQKLSPGSAKKASEQLRKVFPKLSNPERASEGLFELNKKLRGVAIEMTSCIDQRTAKIERLKSAHFNCFSTSCASTYIHLHSHPYLSCISVADNLYYSSQCISDAIILIPPANRALAMNFNYLANPQASVAIPRIIQEACQIAKRGYEGGNLRSRIESYRLNLREANRTLEELKFANQHNRELRIKSTEQIELEKQRAYLLFPQEQVAELFEFINISSAKIKWLKDAYDKHKEICEIISSSNSIQEAFLASIQHFKKGMDSNNCQFEEIELI